jgi:hypothetical protein
MSSAGRKQALAGRDAAVVVTGGKVHRAETSVDGVTYRLEMQFFQTRHKGQCWNGLGRDRHGHIYLGNSSHEDNSWVYRLDPKTGRMRCLGDLLSNLRYGGHGGTDNGKIHSGFLEGPNGDLYFLSHCGHGGNTRYGGHLWRYDVRADRLVDLGVPMPGNTNFCLADIRDGITYTCSTPSGLFIRCDLNRLEFIVLEKTEMNYLRHLPTDFAGHLYSPWGNRIRTFDPKAGHWQVAVRSTETDPDRIFGPVTGFVWNHARTRLHFPSHVQGNLFCWRVGASTIEPLGKLHPDGKPVYLHSLHLNAAEDRLYSLGAGGKRTDKGVYVYDLRSGKRNRLFPLDGIIAHELAGQVRSEPFVDFTDCGGVTGDDGAMYFGFTGGGADQDLDPDGESIVALVAVRIWESDAAAAAPPVAGAYEVADRPTPAASMRPEAMRDVPPALAHADPVSPVEVVGTGIVESYCMAERLGDENGEGQFPLAFWVQLRADPRTPESADALLYVHVGESDNGPDRFMAGGRINVLPHGRTRHDPRFDRHLLRGRRWRYCGRRAPASGDQPSHVDTAADGGSVEIVYDARSVERLADCTVGTTVVFEGAIEPRKPWVENFDGEEWSQDWQLIVTLAGGENVEIGDRLLVESYNFRRCVALMRAGRSVRVRVVGQVWDAATAAARERPRRRPKARSRTITAADHRRPDEAETPYDIHGPILVAVEELCILDDAPCACPKPPTPNRGGDDG